MHDLDRFDRLLLAATAPRAVAETAIVTRSASTRDELAGASARPVVPEREPVITSKRGPKYVDYTACPMCGFGRIGVAYHGELMSGAKVHTLAAHSTRRGCVQRGQPRCLGSDLRVTFTAAGWVGATP